MFWGVSSVDFKIIVLKSKYLIFMENPSKFYSVRPKCLDEDHRWLFQGNHNYATMGGISVADTYAYNGRRSLPQWSDCASTQQNCGPI